MSYPSPPSAGQRDPGGRSRTLLLVAVGFLLLVVVCLVIVLFSGHHGGGNGSSASPATTAPAPSTGNGTPGPPNDVVPTSTPPGVSWSYFHGIALPSSPIYGPTRFQGEQASGYQHSPTGAAVAAANISARLTVGKDWRATLDQQTMPGVGQAAFAAARQKSEGQEDNAVAGTLGQYVGFQVVAYYDTEALVEVVTQFPAYNAALQSSMITMKWDGADWRLELGNDGATAVAIQQISSLRGFIPWGPQ